MAEEKQKQTLVEYLLNSGNEYKSYTAFNSCENCFEKDSTTILVAETAVPFSLCDTCYTDFEVQKKTQK